MNVRITRSMPIEKIPELLNDLAKELRENLHNCSQSRLLIDLSTPTYIKELKQKLAVISLQLQDLESIYAGYTDIIGRETSNENDGDNAPSGSNSASQDGNSLLKGNE